jgi:hypothetical protein
MTIEQVVYNIKRLLTHSNITLETRHSDMHLVTLLSAARITVISEMMQGEKIADPSLLQPLGKLELLPVDAEDLEIPEPEQGEEEEDPYYGIIEIPDVYTISGFKTLFVYTSNKKKLIETVDYPRFLSMIEVEHPTLEFNSISSYLNRILRVYPYTMYVYVWAILKNVMDGTQTDTSHQTIIRPGVGYIVVSGEIDYYEVDENGDIIEAIYEEDDDFVGIMDYPSYVTESRAPLVQRLVQTFPVTFESEFPASPDMIRKMTLLLLTQEFKIEEGKAQDLIYDMKDEGGK